MPFDVAMNAPSITRCLADLLDSGQVYPEAWADRTVVDLRLPQAVERAQRDGVARDDLISLVEACQPGDRITIATP